MIYDFLGPDDEGASGANEGASGANEGASGANEGAMIPVTVMNQESRQRVLSAPIAQALIAAERDEAESLQVRKHLMVLLDNQATIVNNLACHFYKHDDDEAAMTCATLFDGLVDKFIALHEWNELRERLLDLTQAAPPPTQEEDNECS